MAENESVPASISDLADIFAGTQQNFLEGSVVMWAGSLENRQEESLLFGDVPHVFGADGVAIEPPGDLGGTQ